MGLKKLFDKLAKAGGCGPIDDLTASYLGSVECGQFTLDFFHNENSAENCKVEIRCGTQMEVTLKATHQGYGFLMSCYQDGAKDAMEAYCGMLWQCSHLLAVDSYFPKRVVKSWQKYFRGIEKQAQAAAAAVTKEQEEADEALMNEAVRIADMTDEERAEYHKEVEEKLNGILEKENGKL